MSQRSVERYRKGDRKTAPKAMADRIDDTALRAPWQPVVRGRRRKQAAGTGIRVETRARFGCTAPAGPADRRRRADVRYR
ncbi:hypothetical protein ACFWWM_16885 [Streptomyces sp. NPDC058682]|uniref:hypothetical protein n=1 Tax=Streptomyces sp. NPDC058682 TaxID=3346596 RepID=UPI0036532460